MTAAPKTPQDRKPKQPTAGGVAFALDGETFTAYAENITGEHLEALENNMAHVYIRALVGQEAWDDRVKKLPVTKYGEFIKAHADAVNAGNR